MVIRPRCAKGLSNPKSTANVSDSVNRPGSFEGSGADGTSFGKPSGAGTLGRVWGGCAVMSESSID